MSLKNSLNSFFYISIDGVIEIHKRQLTDCGGADGIRNLDGLISAAESSKATFGGEDLYFAIEKTMKMASSSI